ncbi:MAG: mercuric transporter MerT family protein, partial [Anaerolineales bacterium]
MKSSKGSLISTLAAAVSASCCVLPVALLVLGFTSLGPFAVLMRYRPYTLTISFLALAGAFYVVYRPQAAADCAKGVCSPQSLRR